MADYMECPLHWLVISDDYYDQLQVRLEYPDVRDNDGNTLLHAAAMSSLDNSRIVRLLAQRGATVDEYNDNWNTPLHFAVASRNRFAVFYLLQVEAYVHTDDSLGRTPLHFAVCRGQSDGPDPVAITGCDMVIVRELLAHPDIVLDAVDEEGETPLVWAIKEQNLDAFDALRRKGANADIPNKDNRNSLHVALSAETPILYMAQCLLQSGVGIYREDSSQLTPVDMIVRNVRDEETLTFAKTCLRLIAFRYQVRDCLWPKLKQNPLLYHFLDDCLKEVTLMNKLIIFGKVTLHDFLLHSHQMPSGDQVQEIYIPVVEISLSGLFNIYQDFLFDQFSKSDLLDVLAKTDGRGSALDLVPPDAPKESVLSLIKLFYTLTPELKGRLRRFDHLLRK